METIAQQKKELVRMIESVNNPEILELIKNLLSEPDLDAVVREKMIQGALRSEEDYRAGRVLSRQQVIERTNRLFNK